MHDWRPEVAGTVPNAPALQRNNFDDMMTLDQLWFSRSSNCETTWFRSGQSHRKGRESSRCTGIDTDRSLELRPFQVVDNLLSGTKFNAHCSVTTCSRKLPKRDVE
jgi:hypothetical protein